MFTSYTLQGNPLHRWVCPPQCGNIMPGRWYLLQHYFLEWQQEISIFSPAAEWPEVWLFGGGVDDEHNFFRVRYTKPLESSAQGGSLEDKIKKMCSTREQSQPVTSGGLLWRSVVAVKGSYILPASSFPGWLGKDANHVNLFVRMLKSWAGLSFSWILFWSIVYFLVYWFILQTAFKE